MTACLLVLLASPVDRLGMRGGVVAPVAAEVEVARQYRLELDYRFRSAHLTLGLATPAFHSKRLDYGGPYGGLGMLQALGGLTYAGAGVQIGYRVAPYALLGLRLFEGRSEVSVEAQAGQNVRPVEGAYPTELGVFVRTAW